MLSIQSGPAGASPTRFRPADGIERLTPEASNVRLHSKPTSTRSAPRSAIGARRRIGAAPLARRNSQVGAAKTTDPCGEAIGRYFEIPHFTLAIRPIRSPTKKTTAEIAVTAKLLGVSAATKVNTARR